MTQTPGDDASRDWGQPADIPDSRPVPKYGQYAPAPGAGNPPDAYGPQYGQPQYGQTQYGQPGPPNPPGLGAPRVGLGSRPGIIPLRPLSLGEILDGAFNAIRRFPKVTLGLTLLVVGICVTGSTALGATVMPWVSAQFGPWETGSTDTDLALGGLSTVDVYGIALFSGLGMALASIIVSGVLVYAIGQITLGRRPSPTEVWRKVRGRLLGLIGVSLLTGLLVVVVLSVPLLIVWLGIAQEATAIIVTGVILFLLACVAAFALSIMLSLAPSALVLEEIGIGLALRRSWRLVRSSFWRILGITLLTAVIVGTVQQIVGIPLTLVATVVGATTESGTWYLVLTTVSSVLSYTIGAAFTGNVVALLYLDTRMRREGLDVQLAAAVHEGR